MRKILAVGTVAGALVVGAAAGALFFQPAVTNAVDPTASPSTGTSATPLTQAQADAEKAEVTQRATDQVNGTFSGRGHGGDHGNGRGGRLTVEAVTDTSVAAKAIGITEADLTTALDGGQTMAAVAKAHNVDPQKVIDALVADGQAELAAAVKAGTLTQAQADAEKAEVTQRATDQVNGTFESH
jgi:hypothetical protein